MSATATTKSTPGKSRKDKDKDRDKKEKAQPAQDRLKTVVRRLPPNLPEEVFWNSVSDWVKDDTVTWKSFCPGKLAKRINKENVSSRAYIAFKTEELVLEFSRGYDGHLFRDKQGHESQAIVEFAPFQKIPTEKKKVDARMGTIEKDEDFISFMAALNAESSAEPIPLEALIAANQPAPQPKTTPLLEALKAEKAAAKEKEAIQRNHPHYKDGAVTILASRKEDKKKGAQAPKVPEPPAPASKKSKKAAASTTAASSSHNTPKASGSGSAPSGSKVTEPNSKAPANATGSPAKPAKPSKKERQKAAAAKGNAGASVATTTSQDGPKVNPPAVSKAPSSSKPSVPPSVTPSTSAGGQPAPAASATTPATPSATPARRRPVIGIGRGFEAALSGAGVGTDRKPRRPREGDKAPAGDGNPPAATPSAQLAGAPGASTTASDAKPPPTSPKRDRTAKPSIVNENFARIDDAQPTNTGAAAEDGKAPAGNVANTSRGRGRGRGKGRGGNASARGGATPAPTT